MRKTQDKKTLLNIPIEWITHLAILVLQIVIIVIMLCFMNGRWDYVMIFCIIAAAFLFFGFMTVYKLYRARLTVVKLSTEKVTYYAGFKRVEISAENLAVALCDFGKNDKAAKLAHVYDMRCPDDGFILSISGKTASVKWADCVPERLSIFMLSCTAEDVLKRMADDAEVSPALKEKIAAELKARVENNTARQTAAKRRKKRKK